MRITPHGFTTLTSVMPGLLNDELSGGFCLPGGSKYTVDYCETNQGGCTKGCRVSPTINSVAVTPNGTQALNVHVDVKATATIHLSAFFGSCDLGVRIDSIKGDVGVPIGVDAATGELKFTVNPISNFSISDPQLDGCGFAGDILGFLVDLFKGTVADTIRDEISPMIQQLLPEFLPNPLGLVGTMDVGNLLAGLVPGITAKLEARLTPGGYAHIAGGGLSLGVITGLNSDRDPSTRTAGLASEPALCVPPLPAPALDQAPTSLPKTARQTFRLDAAPAFDGIDPPAPADLAIGLSKPMLDLAGHHLVTSGGLCLGIGTSFVSQLNVGIFSLLVPSLAQVADKTNPMLLVTRPQQAIQFTIGDNTATSPAITLGVHHLEIDFYAFIYERYVRVFTADLSLDVGVNLEFAEAGGTTSITPSLVGISAPDVQVSVINTDFISEPASQLAGVLPSVLTLITPLLGNLPAISLPSLAGFDIDNLSIKHVNSNQTDFLAIYGSLAPGQGLRASATTHPLLASAVRRLDATRTSHAAVSTGHARLTATHTPAPDKVRGALAHAADGELPRVEFDVDQVDATGRPLEWSYQLNNGMWRPYRTGPLVIEDAAFAWQGKYTVGLRSRVAGDYHTVSEAQQFPVIIDSVGPAIATDKAAWNDGTFEVPAFDLVSGTTLSYAFGRPGADKPDSPWVAGGTARLGREASGAYADDRGQVAVYVRDEVGNTSVALVTPSTVDAGGCSTTGGAPGAGGLVLVLLVGGLVLARRRRTARAVLAGALWTGGAVLMSMQPACSCNSKSADEKPTMCEMDSDCPADACPGQLPFCIDQTCQCSDDIPPGRIGPYSHVAVGPDGAIWVSAYAESHGDLVVAKVTASGRIDNASWEWVDGVPAGPIVIPGSTTRNGVSEAGPDVGMYTSIAVAGDGTPSVAYFDHDTASLKLAQKINGAWTSHVVDAGTGALGDGGALVGMYTSLSLRTDDGRPGIAYLAHVKDAKGTRAEVRFASAQTAHPASSADWQFWVVDTAPLPSDNPDSPDIYPLPAGLGVFIDSARLPDQSPVVAYYDRAAGDLKLAKFNVAAGQFGAPRVLDGSGGIDAGWTPSVAVDAKGVVNVAYVGVLLNDDLRIVTDAPGATPQIVDDGYRIDGMTADGLPKPVFHFVGNNASLVLTAGGPQIAYQDATTQELQLAQKGADGKWTHTSIAGGTAGGTKAFAGGYGFFASDATANGQLVMSSWVINLPAETNADENWVEVFTMSAPQ
ncbi:MAG TPA: MYXO-CTERM sorting domain-containing protein [Kofleriaceae bacterium]